MGIFNGGLLSILGGGKNPAKAAMPYLNQIPQVGKDAYNPFIQQGQQAAGQLSPIYSQMAGDPSGYLNQLLGAYEPSKGYQYRENKLNQQAHNTAAAGGYAGTGGDIQGRSELINALMGEDMQQFLENIFRTQGAGMQGLENSAGRGFQASGSLADFLGSNLGQQASMAYGGQASKNANQNALFNALLSAAGTGTGAYFGAKAAGAPLPATSSLSSFGNQAPFGSQAPLTKINFNSPRGSFGRNF